MNLRINKRGLKRLSVLVSVTTLVMATGCGEMNAPHVSADIEYNHTQTEEELFSSWWESVASWLGWGTYGTSSDRGNDTPAVDKELRYSDFTHVGKKVLDVLEDEFATEKYRTWNFSGDAEVEGDWVLQTPDVWNVDAKDVPVAQACDADQPRCNQDFGLLSCYSDSDCDNGGVCRLVDATVTHPYGAASKLCVGHSDDFVDELYNTMIEANEFVDISTLTAPDGRFLAATRNAMTYLANTGKTIQVRVVYGGLPGMGPSALVEELTRDFNGQSNVTINAGIYNMGLDSWNHSKIIAVDGHKLVTGGHNMWTDHYLTDAPIHDLSMRVTGTVADDAHYFLNELWDTTCENYYFTGMTSRAVYPSWRSSCPARWDGALADSSKEGARVISVARLGALGLDPADKAMLAMIRSAQTSLKLSLQDIGPIQLGAGLALSGWPEEVLEELARAVARGVDIYLVLSSPGSIPGGLNGASANYGNGWTPQDVTEKAMEWLQARPDLIPAGKNARDLFCEHFHSAYLRFSDDAAWAGGENIGNHSKFFIVDDIAFYLGSQNLYPSNLAEHGLIVDDVNLTSQIINKYWSPLWANGGPTSVSGYEVSGCGL
jgi:phosphatidylserine/phosphatidylglycerophosphate/cardiolipin synthase-like enzyme